MDDRPIEYPRDAAEELTAMPPVEDANAVHTEELVR
jgi:hypothetical protein